MNRAGMSGKGRESKHTRKGLRSMTEKPEELSSMALFDEASFKRSTHILRQEPKRSTMFQRAQQQAQYTGAVPVCQEFQSHMSAEKSNIFALVLQMLPHFGRHLGAAVNIQMTALKEGPSPSLALEGKAFRFLEMDPAELQSHF